MRPIGGEQSNSSIVFGDTLILKAFRRLEPGVNPELEVLRFLSARGFAHIAPLIGWYDYEGRLMNVTLGTLQEYLAGARDGWELALEDLEGFVPLARDLGRVTGEMHTALGSEASDPDFAPEEPSVENLSLLTATIDEEIERVFVDLDETDERVAPIAGRGQDARERLQALSHIGAGGRLIRTHGDYHLGQTMLADRGWVILDFEGEPARPLPERRRKRSPLRDVAGMLRSFAYVASAAELQRGTKAPEGWEDESARGVPGGLLLGRRPEPPAAGPRGHRGSCWRCSSWRRRCTSCATSSTTGRTGWASRWPGSRGCSSPCKRAVSTS